LVAAGSNSVGFTITTYPVASSTSVTISASYNNSSQSASLTVNPNSPAVGLSPSSLTFGNQAVNTTSSPRTFTLTNTGTATLVISNIQIATATGGNIFQETNPCPMSPQGLGSGGSCTISVTFTPAAFVTYSGDITVSDNASGSPQTVSLSGTGAG
jgi:hypothetical protein